MDALAAHIRTLQPARPGLEAESLSQAITYTSTVVRALGKGTAEYKNLFDHPENYAVPPPMMRNFIVPYVRDNGLLALMQHPEFAKSLSVDLGYASQNPRPAGKKDFTAIRAEYAQSGIPAHASLPHSFV